MLNRSFRELSPDILSYGTIAMLRASASLLMLPILVNALSPSDYAIIDLINTGVAFFQLFIMRVMLGTTRFYFVHEDGAERRLHVASTFWGLVFISTLAAIGVVVASQFISFDGMLGDDVDPTGVILAFLALPALVLFEFYLQIIRMDREKRRFAIFAIGEAYVRAFLIIGFVFLFGGLESYFWGGLISSCVFAIAVMAKSDLPHIRPRLAVLLRTVRYTLPTYPGMLVRYVGQNGLRFIALAWLTLDQMAVFAFAMKFSIIVKLFTKALQMAWRPIAMRHIAKREESSDAMFRGALATYTMVAVIGVIAVSLLSYIIVDFMAPEAYAAAKFIVPLLAAGFLLGGAQPVLEVGIEAVEETHWQSVATVVGVGLGLLVMVLLIGPIGPSAIALSILVSSTVTSALVLLAGQTRFRVGHDWRTLAALFVLVPGLGVGLSVAFTFVP
ncbi:MAG: O-antigen/teichoic acid export membrane protein [Afipia broomeae]